MPRSPLQALYTVEASLGWTENTLTVTLEDKAAAKHFKPNSVELGYPTQEAFTDFMTELFAVQGLKATKIAASFDNTVKIELQFPLETGDVEEQLASFAAAERVLSEINEGTQRGSLSIANKQTVIAHIDALESDLIRQEAEAFLGQVLTDGQSVENVLIKAKDIALNTAGYALMRYRHTAGTTAQPTPLDRSEWQALHGLAAGLRRFVHEGFQTKPLPVSHDEAVAIEAPLARLMTAHALAAEAQEVNHRMSNRVVV